LGSFKIEDVHGNHSAITHMPRMVRRVVEVLEAQKDILVTTKRLASKLGVTHGALLMHTANPALSPYRLVDGTKTYWGSQASVEKARKEMEAAYAAA
jgi:hypothetical protein